MADPHNAFIQHLRRQARGNAGPKRMTCPVCRKESEAFAGNESFFSHIEEAHPPSKPSTWDPKEQLKLINDAYQTTQEFARNASAPTSPRSGSKASDLDGQNRQSSVRAEPGSRSPSRSPSTEGAQEAQLRSKRRYQADLASDYPLKLPARGKMDSISGHARIGSSPGIRPEDVDPDFKRSPGSGPASNTNPLSRKLFEPGPHSPSAPQPRVVQGSGHGTSRPAEMANTSQSRRGSNTNTGHASSASIPSASNSRPSSSSSNRHPGVLRLRYNPQWPTLVLQPESKDISQEQLAAEVKSIYTGLTMVETKCIHIDKAQQATPRSESRITDEHWQAMIALHRTLLHEHHDFFLASQHPSASPALKRLALKYSMPARMWKHGIHSFLELLRHRLPESLEYMLAFIYLAYQMMALLYETVGTFRNTWIECLGDLGRYRMAVEDEDVRDREIWAGVARSWYNKAADTNPAIGRLFHHLAILARPNMVQQLYLYNRSLTSIMPFMNARESIVTIFDPILSQNPPLQLSQSDTSLIKVHALLFKKKDLDAVQPAIDSYIKGLIPAICQAGDKFRELGAFTGIANIGALFDFGNDKSPMRFLFELRRKAIQQKDPKSMPPGLPEDQSVPDIQLLPDLDPLSQRSFNLTVHLVVSTFKAALSRRADKNVLSLVHVTCVFLLHIVELACSFPEQTYVRSLLDAVPWNDLCSFINTFVHSEDNLDPGYKTAVLFEEGGRPLPEDWMLRGLSWSFEYCPRAWFKDAAVTEEEERYMELTSTMKARVDRVLSLAVQIAKTGNWIDFNPETSRFSVVGQADVDMVDDDEGYDSDSQIMNEIRENERTVEGSTKLPPADCAALLRTEYGTIVPNLDVLKQTELVNIILDHSKMAMVIPHECMTTLLDSANAYDVSSNEAAAALHNIRSALNEHRNITIQDAKAQDLTKYYAGSLATFFSERPKQQGRSDFTSTASLKPDNVIGTLHAVARQNSDPMRKASRTATGLFSRTTTGLSEVTMPPADEMSFESLTGDLQVQPGFPMPDDRPAVVITDDRKVRAQVDKLGTAAIAGWMVKKWLMQAKKNHGGREASAIPMDVDQKIETSAGA